MTKLLSTLVASAFLLTGTAMANGINKTVAQMDSAAPAASASPAAKSKAKMKKAAKKPAASASPAASPTAK